MYFKAKLGFVNNRILIFVDVRDYHVPSFWSYSSHNVRPQESEEVLFSVCISLTIRIMPN